MLLIPKTYFIIIQGIILILFLVTGLKKEKGKYFLFSSEINFYFLILGAIIIGYLFNRDYQLFCIPVNWTKVVLLIFLIYFLGNKIFKKVIGEFTNQLILGVGLFVSLYIIGFGGMYYLIWTTIHSLPIVLIYFLSKYLNKKFNTQFFDFMNFFGVTLLLPYIIISWILWQVWNKRLKYKIALSVLPVTILIIGIFLTIRMSRIIESINNSENKLATIERMKDNKINYYLTELILGAHWKYHTTICLFDGWRPPFHDPVLGFAVPFLYSREHLFNYELNINERFDLYKKAFPENKTQFDCKCANNERLIPIE
ncbi:MAG: hypothetical protein HXX09_14465 [Bacteroidetes bacterium]|nr:hypothetical protein [Bacteroidota bacterium]